MTEAAQSDDEARIVLGLLESVERDGGQSQRRLAAELDIALGLVNAYIKRCVSKGLVKVRHVPARRYAYYLTPKGFAEKSRLTVQYLTTSLSFFREAKTDCAELMEAARQRGIERVVLAGASDLAEIAAICAMQCGIEVVAVVDPDESSDVFLGVPVVPGFDALKMTFDAVMITNLDDSYNTCARARARFDDGRVLVPRLLRLPAASGALGKTA